MRAVEDADFALIWSAYGPSVELYSRAQDPEQRQNLARRHPERVRALSEALEATPPSWSALLPVQHRGETEELLRRLGYVE